MSKKDMKNIDETEKFDDNLISTETLHDICDVATAHVETKTLNMRHQAQKGFRGIFVGIPQHQKDTWSTYPVLER